MRTETEDLRVNSFGRHPAESLGERAMILGLLNGALATELVCMLRYRSHYYAARRAKAPYAADAFFTYASDELNHADQLAERISELGGEPDFSPTELALRSHADYVGPSSIIEMIRINLVAERIEVERYRDLIHHIGNGDLVTTRLLEKILSEEQAQISAMKHHDARWLALRSAAATSGASLAPMMT